jgi:hypothetical protein
MTRSSDELDALNAQRFVAAFGHEIRFWRDAGWHAFNGAVWTPEGAEQKARDAAFKLPALMANEAISILIAADRLSGAERKLERSRGNKLLARAGQTCDAARRERLLVRAAELIANDPLLI